MALKTIVALASAKKYTEDTIIGEGAIKGKDGKNGADGEPAYQIAVNNGFVGTEQDWLDSLKGADGKDGKDGSGGDATLTEDITVIGVTVGNLTEGTTLAD